MVAAINSEDGDPASIVTNVRNCFARRCQHQRRGAGGGIQCAHLDRLLTNSELRDAGRFISDEAEWIAQVFCVVADSVWNDICYLGCLSNDVVNREEFFAESSVTIFKQLLSKVIWLLGGEVATWTPFKLVKRRAPSSPSSSQFLPSALCSIIVGTFARDELVARETLSFLINARVGWTGDEDEHSRTLLVFSGTDENKICAQLQAKLFETCAWVKQVAPLLGKVLCGPFRTTNVCARGEPAKRVQERFWAQEIDERETVAALITTDACPCGTTWCDTFDAKLPDDNEDDGGDGGGRPPAGKRANSAYPLRCCAATCLVPEGGCRCVVICR